jgi:TPR repeat protein
MLPPMLARRSAPGLLLAALACGPAAPPTAPAASSAPVEAPEPTEPLDPLAEAIALELRHTVASRRKAFERYEALCREANARACYHFEQAERTTGMKGTPRPAHTDELERMCDAGDMAVCYELALTLDDDGGLPKDAERAFELSRRACDGGYVFACSRVATFYLVSVPSQEPGAGTIALRHAWRACEAGLGDACHLATLVDGKHRRPAGVPNRDELYELACRRGSLSSCKYLSEQAEPTRPFACDQCGDVVDMRCSDCEMTTLIEKHCCDTCPERMTSAACADIDLVKTYPRTSTPMAAGVLAAARERQRKLLEPVVAWLTPSCKTGHIGACFDLALLLRNSKSPLHDAKRSLELLTRSCESESASACDKLADDLNAAGDSDASARMRARAKMLHGRACKQGHGGACWGAMD